LTHSQPLHHARPVHLDRAHADPEIKSDQLVRPARQQSVKNFPFARTESRDPLDGVGDIEIGMAFFSKRGLNRLEQSVIAVWLFQKIGGACLHRANSRLNISLSGDDNNG